jgi:hypothetical protein
MRKVKNCIDKRLFAAFIDAGAGNEICAKKIAPINRDSGHAGVK